jgi:hypothetical protein
MAMTRLQEGERVEVRQRFTEKWCRGFEVASVDLTGDQPAYKLRRRSDGEVLNAPFPAAAVRLAISD